MSRSKRGLILVGFCIALGAAVLSTGASQAEPGAKWSLIKANGELVTISGALLPEVAMTEIVTKDMTLLSEIGKKPFEMLCLGASFINARLEAEGRVGGGNKVEFTGCTVKIGGVTQVSCKPHTNGKPEGTVLSSALKGLIVLNTAGSEPRSVIKFEPVTGETFMTLVLGVEGESECSLGELCSINGVSTVTEEGKGLETEQESHFVSQFAAMSDLWVLNKTAEHKVTVDGQGKLGLAGEHKGLKWAGTAS